MASADGCKEGMEDDAEGLSPAAGAVAAWLGLVMVPLDRFVAELLTAGAGDTEEDKEVPRVVSLSSTRRGSG